MDPSLMREREAFKKRAHALPVVEKRKSVRPAAVTDSEYLPESNKKQKTAQRQETSASVAAKLDYRNATPSSQLRFAVLAKIIKYMRTRHQQGEDYGLSVDEVLDETKQYDVAPKIRAWLMAEALLNNPKITVDRDNKYKYRPSFDIRDKKGLLRLLQEHNQGGLGGIFMEDVEESLPNAQAVLEELKGSVIILKRQTDKRLVVYYKDPSVAVDVPEDMVKLWRSVSVEGMDEKKIADHLEKQGFSFIKNDQKKPLGPGKKRGRKGGLNGKFVPKHNDHIKDLLQDYSAKVPK